VLGETIVAIGVPVPPATAGNPRPSAFGPPTHKSTIGRRRDPGYQRAIQRDACMFTARKRRHVAV
jgi:hypothetical protein